MEAFVNAVDVVELVLVPTNQALNVRHLRVLHTFSLMTSLELLIQQSVEGRDRAKRVQNLEMPYLWCLIGRNVKKFDYINHVVKCFRFQYTRVRGHTLPLLLLCIF